MRSRSVVALALVAALLAVPCLGVCAGWAASHHDRMACCADKHQDEADACCASTEGRQNSETVAGLVVVALPALQPIASAVASAVTVQRDVVNDLDSHDPLTSDTERHVLLSVFLI